MMVRFTVDSYPVSVHGKANNLGYLVQQNIFRDIVFYASHNLKVVKSAGTKIRSKYGMVKRKNGGKTEAAAIAPS